MISTDVEGDSEVKQALELFREFLKEQVTAIASLKKRYPEENVDLYQGCISELLENLRVLMYYRILPVQLDSLLKLFKSQPEFELWREPRLGLEVFRKIADNMKVLLYGHGQLLTFNTHRPVDSEGQPTPWITYPALEFLNQFNFASQNVFEFGAGNSTFFWASRAKQVFSVETEKDWFDELNLSKPSNVTLLYFEEEQQFSASILEVSAPLNVIVIDSIRHRYSATVSAIKRIAPGGLIVFDNSDWYPNSCAVLTDAGFVRIDFHGFGPVNGYTWTTSLFFKHALKFDRVQSAAVPVGGLVSLLEDDQPK